MTAPPCICPTDNGLRTATDPKCFDHAPWTQHPSKYVVKLRRPKTVAASILTAAAAIASLSATPAEAADPYIWICNDFHSVDNITAWSDNPYYRISINQNNCKQVNDRGGNARVDVDPAGGEADVDSYYIYTDNYPYGGGRIGGPCHDGENGSSNPDSSGVKTSHYVTSSSGCP